MTLKIVKKIAALRSATTAIKPCSISPGRPGTPGAVSPGCAGLETRKQIRGRPATPRIKALAARHKSPAGLARTGSGGFCILVALKPRGISLDSDPSQNTPLRAPKGPMNFLPEGFLSRRTSRLWRMGQAGFRTRVDSQEVELFYQRGVFLICFQPALTHLRVTFLTGVEKNPREIFLRQSNPELSPR